MIKERTDSVFMSDVEIGSWFEKYNKEKAKWEDVIITPSAYENLRSQPVEKFIENPRVENLRGIEFTEKWAKKFGFVRNTDRNFRNEYYRDDQFGTHTIKIDVVFTDHLPVVSFERPFAFVHQFQQQYLHKTNQTIVVSE